MSFECCPEITPALLTKLAGPKACEKGIVYYESGAVAALVIAGQRVTAEVTGSEHYRVELVYNQRGLGGGCDCPASEGIDFCKHCVAVALTLKEEIEVQGRKTAGSKTKKKATPEEIIGQWLHKQDKDEVIRQMVDLVSQDRQLQKLWQLKAESGLGYLDQKALKKKITALFPLKSIYKYPQVRAYFSLAEASLQELEQPLRNLPADERIILMDYAFERLSKALGTVDDSGGFRYDCLYSLQKLYIEAFSQLTCSDEDRAARLLKMALDGEPEFYGQVPDDYEGALSTHCLVVFYSLAQQQWDLLPERKEYDYGCSLPYWELGQLLERHARKNNDIDALIAVKEKTAFNIHDRIDLAQLHFEKKNYEKAQAFLDRVKAQDTHNYGHGHELQVRLYQAQGKGEEALLCQWAHFRNQTSMEQYQTLLQIAQQEDSQTDWSARAMAWLRDNLEEKVQPGQSYSYETPCSDTLIGIYVSDREWNQAWQVVGGFRASSKAILALARATARYVQDGFWNKILVAFVGLASSKVDQGNNTAYRDAVSLLQELYTLATGEPQVAAVERSIAGVVETYKRKRNFIAYLTKALPQLALA